MSDSVQPHRRQPTRLLHPWDSPGKNTGVGCHFLLQCRKGKSEREVAQSCPTLCDPMDCSLPGSSVHRIFQARVPEWVAIAFSQFNGTTSFIMDSKPAWPLHYREVLSLLNWTINKPSLCSKPEFFNLSTVDILDWILLCCEDSQIVRNYKILNRFLAHYPLEVCSIWSFIMSKNVPRNRQMSPWKQITFSWEWLFQRKSLSVFGGSSPGKYPW